MIARGTYASQAALAAAAVVLSFAPVAVALAQSPAPAGWYAGDPHVHRSCGGSPEAIASVQARMEPNDLAVISLLADMGNGEVQDAALDLPRVTGADDPSSTPGRIVHWDAEWHWDPIYFQFEHQALGGHVVALGLSEAQQRWEEYTAPVLEWARSRGAVAGFAHMQYLDDAIPQSLTCCTPIEYPVEVALGTADFISEDVVAAGRTVGGMNPEAAVRAYYRLLNSGFRPGYAAGTDYPCDAGPDLGALLTYVQVPGPLTYRSWVDGIAAGRTVVSRNGHKEFLNLVVDGAAGPGDDVALDAGGSVSVTVTWTAAESLSGTLELVSNGVVVASQAASAAPGAPATLTATLPFPRSGWVAARRNGPGGHHVHTGAVFVTVAGAPVRASVADASFYVAWMDNLLARTSPGGAWSSYFPTSLAAAQDRYRAARAVFEQIAAEAAAAEPPPPAGASSLWPDSAAPVVADGGPDSAVELGVKFRSDVDGLVTGVRFYKSAANAGTHVGSLWTSAGTRLATGTFTNETASGWQRLEFATPVPIAADTVYVASYHTTAGHYAADQQAFAASGVDRPPLHALRDGESGANGVYAYGSTSRFPSSGYRSTNYWVDVVFQPAAPPAALTAVAVAPSSASLEAGATRQLQATGTYADGTTQDLTATATWTSSSPAVATVSAGGLVTAVGPGAATITASQGGVGGTASVTVTAAPLAVATSSLPAGSVGAPYSATLAASGGVSPYAWSAGAGLPPGLALSTGGVLSGTPSAAGTYAFTVEVRDAAAQVATRSLAVVVGALAPAYTLWPASAAPGVADAGPDSAVELGVRFRSSVDGHVTGVRFFKGVGNVGTHVGNLWSSAGTRLATATFAGETATGWQEVSFAAPVPITAGTIYVASYHAPVGHYAASQGYFASAWLAPPLEALANSNGLNGVYAYGTTSSFPRFAWNATNYWVDVVFRPAAPAPALTAVAVAPATATLEVGATRQLQATGTYSDGTTQDLTATAAWTSSLPAVATVGAGLVTAVSPGGVTITASQGGLGGTAGVTVTAAPLAVTTSSLPEGTLAVPYAATLAASGGAPPYAWAAEGGLPPGLALAPSGALSGTPGAIGTFELAVRVTDAASVTAARTLPLTIAPPPPLDVATAALPAGSVGTPYSATLAASGGVPPYAWSAGAGLPPGLALSAGGALSGTPSVQGTYEFTVQVQDAAMQVAARTLSVAVAAFAPAYTLWPASATPGVADSGPDSAVELGVRFRASVDGHVTGVRFYKGAGNTGTHVGNLWSSTGTRLATATFTGETATGWQQASFATPVAITAGTVYVASYHAPAGHYAADSSYFATAWSAPPLEALANSNGLNGVYAYGTTSSFPRFAWNATNYWVDVVFRPASPLATLTAVAVSPESATLEGFVSRQLTASGTYSDGTTLDLTATATWTSSDPSVAAVSGSGLATGAGFGAATITAAAGGLSATATLTVVPPPPEGPGGPILVVSSSANPFSRYYAEILRAEGLNAFTAMDVAEVTSATLADRDVVILGDFRLSPEQVAMLTEWVQAGGSLVAMRPDPGLAGLLGLAATGGTLAEGYVLVDVATPPGDGIVGEPVQFHGTADLYELAGATPVATLYSSAAAATTAPAVTTRAVGAGNAAAFTYDLARSVVLTRQGNPAWSGQERDGTTPIRSNDLFYGAASFDPQRDWVDFTRIDIPQADEQQRLLTNLLLHLTRARKPLPRFWFLPSGHRAAVVLTGDDHAGGGTAGRFAAHLAASPAGCSVEDWSCVRSTSYVYPNAPLTADEARSYTDLGFEVALHVSTSCWDWEDEGELDALYAAGLALFSSKYVGVPPPATNRTHCAVWSDYDTQPKVALANGIRLDANYYYWPGSWIGDRPGLMTGSGLPMRFADRAGRTIDVYQAATQLTDESEQAYPLHVDTLLDNALGPKGYFGVFTANMHTDVARLPEDDAIVASALARGVPLISAQQLLTWLDARDGSSFRALAWDGEALSFEVVAASGARNLRALLPAEFGGLPLSSITREGAVVPSSTETIKGVSYVTFPATTGAYRAVYR